jgi:hypothetical protein
MSTEQAGIDTRPPRLVALKVVAEISPKNWRAYDQGQPMSADPDQKGGNQ